MNLSVDIQWIIFQICDNINLYFDKIIFNYFLSFLIYIERQKHYG
jgi:hypothetical protein